MRRTVGSIAVLLGLSLGILSAAGSSEVADAVMRGDQAAVEKLVAQHADMNAPQADGATALHWAVFRSRRCGSQASTEMPQSSRR